MALTVPDKADIKHRLCHYTNAGRASIAIRIKLSSDSQGQKASVRVSGQFMSSDSMVSLQHKCHYINAAFLCWQHFQFFSKKAICFNVRAAAQFLSTGRDDPLPYKYHLSIHGLSTQQGGYAVISG